LRIFSVNFEGATNLCDVELIFLLIAEVSYFVEQGAQAFVGLGTHFLAVRDAVVIG
jgi:hypothetical protein